MTRYQVIVDVVNEDGLDGAALQRELSGNDLFDVRVLILSNAANGHASVQVRGSVTELCDWAVTHYGCDSLEDLVEFFAAHDVRPVLADQSYNDIDFTEMCTLHGSFHRYCDGCAYLALQDETPTA